MPMLAVTAILLLTVSTAIAAEKQIYPYASIDDACKAAGFDPAAKGSFYFAATADPHVQIKPGMDGFPRTIIEEVNRMRPKPAFLAVSGDLIVSASICFGHLPSIKEKEKATAEFTAFKDSLRSLDPGIPLKLTLGNHDTYPYEPGAELFRKVFENYPLYSSCDIDGVHCVFLNGGASGDIDKEQRRWMKEDIANIPGSQTVIMFVHQPALDQTVHERGMAQALKEVFAGHTGELWLICGHDHCNAVKVFSLPSAKIVQAKVTTCNPQVWGSEKPGYWIYCVKDGHVKARVFRRLDSGFRIDAEPDFSKATPIPEPPFDNLKGKLWGIFVGDGDRKYLVKGEGGDAVSWWAYIKDLVYRLPLSEAGNKAERFALLADLGPERGDKANRVYVSANGGQWQELPLPNQKGGVYLFPIPESLRKAKDLHVRIEGRNSDCIVGGFALCR